MLFKLFLWYNVVVGIGVLNGIKGDYMSFFEFYYVFIQNRSSSLS